MGWFSKLFKNIVKNFTPIGLVAGPDNVNKWFGDKPAEAAPAAAPAAAAPATPTITDAEAETTSAKRLARMGKYFTSPLGVLSGASTGSQKIFS